MKIIQSKKFTREAAKLIIVNPQLKSKLLEVYKMLEENVFNPKLRTHKLKDEFEGRWSCSLSYSIRIIFRFSEEGKEKKLELLTIGSHDAVY